MFLKTRDTTPIYILTIGVTGAPDFQSDNPGTEQISSAPSLLIFDVMHHRQPGNSDIQQYLMQCTHGPGMDARAKPVATQGQGLRQKGPPI